VKLVVFYTAPQHTFVQSRTRRVFVSELRREFSRQPEKNATATKSMCSTSLRPLCTRTTLDSRQVSHCRFELTCMQTLVRANRTYWRQVKSNRESREPRRPGRFHNSAREIGHSRRRRELEEARSSPPGRRIRNLPDRRQVPLIDAESRPDFDMVLPDILAAIGTPCGGCQLCHGL